MEKSSTDEQLMNLEVLHPNAAGIDIGNAAHYVAVPPDRDTEPVRKFACFTQDVRGIADWLKQCGIVTVAMQSTGVYWLPVYEVLVERGFEVFLVNARHTKNLPGRKSDVQECQWLMKLHTYGLLNNSFRPTEEICVLRTYWRQRDEHVKATRNTVIRALAFKWIRILFRCWKDHEPYCESTISARWSVINNCSARPRL